MSKETNAISLFESIFYEEKVVRQFFAGFTNFWTFGETFETIFDQKKVVRQMDLPSQLLVDFLKQSSTRKNWCFNFFDGFPDFRNFGETFETIFDEKKVVRQTDLPSRLLVDFLKRFSTRKNWCFNFLMDFQTSGILIRQNHFIF